ncbi:hypothetical protein [Pediococcus pentosaceus]|uniref:hypothetical protein n=1 Tax=Pediococcus pentosaceus TaxID=1255 RepID=UPI00223BC958|nr:hypothetical protein [Pediococcus pentosaceus]MCS8573779.1 hypothetical protein [Pediococcus pentosaceus]
MKKLSKISLITDDLTDALDDENRKQLVGNFEKLQKNSDDVVDDLNSAKTDHEDILTKLAEVKRLEEANAKRLDQQHLNMEQIVEVLQYFNTPVGWDGENIVIRKDI